MTVLTPDTVSSTDEFPFFRVVFLAVCSESFDGIRTALMGSVLYRGRNLRRAAY